MPTSLAETTMDPRHRTLRRITVDDADAAARVFELLMGSDVALRKEFIVQGAYDVDVEALDACRRVPRQGDPRRTTSTSDVEKLTLVV